MRGNVSGVRKLLACCAAVAIIGVVLSECRGGGPIGMSSDSEERCIADGSVWDAGRSVCLVESYPKALRYAD